MDDAPRHKTKVPAAIGNAVVRWRWPILYVITVAAMFWWYEIRPARIALGRLQGAWRAVGGAIPNEHSVDSHLYFKQNAMWRVAPPYDDNTWPYHITVRPADNFFIVQYPVGSRRAKSETVREYIVCLKGDALYQLHGLARFDGVQANTIEKLYRVDSLPDAAKKAVQQHTDSIARSPFGK